MSKRKNVNVGTFGRCGTVSVQVASSASASDIKLAILKQIGAKPASAQLFSVFVGLPGSPAQRLEESAEAPVATNICLQRWAATTDREAKTALTDPVATNLLAEEAAHYLRTGRIAPSLEERKLLDDYLDPSFPSERQFLEAVCKVEGYCAFEALECMTRSVVDHNRSVIPRDTQVVAICYPNRLQLRTRDNTTACWSWRQIKRWRLSGSKQAEFELFSQNGGIGVLNWLYIESEQATFLLQAAMLICTHLQESTISASEQVERGKLIDPLHEYLNIKLFGSGPNFSEFKESLS